MSDIGDAIKPTRRSRVFRIDERLTTMSTCHSAADAMMIPDILPVGDRSCIAAMNQRSHRGAERLARSLNHTKSTIDGRDVLAVLRALPFSQNSARRNVMSEGQDWIYSQCAGLTPSGLPSRLMNKCPEVVRLLARYMLCHADGDTIGTAASCTAQAAKYPFTSITMNFNYESRVHRDTFHVGGRSRIVALGDFDGGELWVDGTGCIDVKDHWHDFDGTQQHSTMPFVGERYSLIYFMHESAQYVTGPDRQPLLDLGFRWPSPALALPHPTDAVAAVAGSPAHAMAPPITAAV